MKGLIMKFLFALLLSLAGLAAANSGDTTRLDTLAYGEDTCDGAKTCRYAQVKIHAGTGSIDSVRKSHIADSLTTTTYDAATKATTFPGPVTSTGFAYATFTRKSQMDSVPVVPGMLVRLADSLYCNNPRGWMYEGVGAVASQSMPARWARVPDLLRYHVERAYGTGTPSSGGSTTLSTSWTDVTYPRIDGYGNKLVVPGGIWGSSYDNPSYIDVKYVFDWAPSIKTSTSKLYVNLRTGANGTGVSLGVEEINLADSGIRLDGSNGNAVLIHGRFLVRSSNPVSSNLASPDVHMNWEYAAAGVTNAGGKTDPPTGSGSKEGRMNWAVPATIDVTSDCSLYIRVRLDVGGVTSGTLYDDALEVRY
jgi:hypothetical protein